MDTATDVDKLYMADVVGDVMDEIVESSRFSAMVC